MAITCARCRGAVPTDARFCSNCGLPVEPPTALDDERHARAAAAVPPTLADRLRSTFLAGERKPVTVLFADIVGSTSIVEQVDDEDWTAIVSDTLDLLARAVYRYEGTVARLMGDGLLAFFGAPIAHEDDPERAVRAGLDAIADLAAASPQVDPATGIALQVRVGVNTGPVVVGAVGSELVYEYTAIGDAVNVAARLQGVARPGTVAISDATHRFVAHRFDVRDLGALQLKGKRSPVHAFEVVGLAERPTSGRGIPGLESPLVGRSAELAELEGMARAASDGTTRAALLVGEPGIGKSRLLAEFRDRTGWHGERAWIEGRCLSYGRTLPYHLLLDLLRSVLGVPEDADENVATIALRSQVDALLGPSTASVQAALGHLLSLPLGADEAEAIDRLQPRARHLRYLAAVRTVLEALTERGPVALVCEDVHWADASSVELLRELMPSLQRILLVCTSRPEVGTPGWELLERIRSSLGPHCLEVSLRPLSDTETRVLVGALLEIESLPARVRDLILDRAEGNPFFLEEILRMLIDRGAIERRDQRWVALEATPTIELPGSIHGLLLGRIDRLPDGPKRAARLASVIGRRFPARLLTEMLGEDASEALGVLEAAGLIATVPTETAEPEYQFRHALLQEATYDSILRRDRQPLHRQVAETLERVYADRRAELAAVLALHLERAGEHDRSLGYLIEAGEHAQSRFAVHEARALFDRAAVLLADADDPERLRLEVRVGLARLQAGWTFVPYVDELELVETLLPLAERLEDLHLIAATHLWRARLRFGHGELPETSPELRASLEQLATIAETVGDDRLLALPRFLAEGEARFGAGDYRGTIATFEEVVPTLESAGDDTLASMGAGLAAVAAARLGEFDDADRWLERQRELADHSGDPGALLDHDLHRGMVASERGELARGRKLAEQGTEAARRVDNKACEVVGTFVLGEQELRAGRSVEAIVAFERTQEVARYCGAINVENLASAWLAAARSQSGAPEQALTALDQALLGARGMGDRLAEGQILQLRAMVRARGADPDWAAARADFGAALEVFRSLGTRPQEARALRQYGLALQLAGERDGAVELLQRASALSDALGLADDEAGILA
jgi:class 3 adenylate cyclase/tetratricopeptide (TPR) repeat protein